MDAAGPDGRTKRVKVTIWDTAGQERFRTLTSSYYRGAQGIILVYDVARKETFDSLSMWLQEVEQFSMGGGKEVVKLLVGNKVDQPRVVSRDVADDWARSRGMLFMEASAKTKEGISQVFNEVVQKVSHSRYTIIEFYGSLSFHRSSRTQHYCPTLVQLSQVVETI